jgi:hypothetical protein
MIGLVQLPTVYRSANKLITRYLVDLGFIIYASSRIVSASGAFLITDLMPLLQPARRLYIWLVPITWWFLAIKTK